MLHGATLGYDGRTFHITGKYQVKGHARIELKIMPSYLKGRTIVFKSRKVVPLYSKVKLRYEPKYTALPEISSCRQ